MTPLTVLEEVFAPLVPRPLEYTNAHDAFMRAIYAVGLARLGGDAAPIASSLTAELDQHAAPNRVLLGLYVARATTHVHAPLDEWAVHVDALVDAVADVAHRRVVSWMAKRSAWLHGSAPAAPPSGLRPSYARILTSVDAASSVEALAEAVALARPAVGAYDYELAALVDAFAELAPDPVRAAIVVSLGADFLARVRIPTFRVFIALTCLRLAVIANDRDAVDRLPAAVASAMETKPPPGPGDVASAFATAFARLVRLDARDIARRLIALLDVSPRVTGAEPLLAALADAHRALGDGARARELLDECLAAATHPRLTNNSRYQAHATFLAALAAWDLDTRRTRCAEVVAHFDALGDTFTAHVLLATHKLLVAEHLVDAIGGR